MRQVWFVIYSQRRTGSALVTLLLNSHPQVRCYGDLFHPNRWQGWPRRRLQPAAFRFPHAHLKLRILLAGRPAAGFKLLINQNEQLHNLLVPLSVAGWKVIHRQRRSLLIRNLSAAMLHATGLSHSRSQSRERDAPVVIKPERFLRLLRQSARWSQLEAERLQGVPHLTLMYEDDLADAIAREATAARLLAYLSLPLVPLHTDLVKTYQRPYSELITNYAELVELASAHGCAETP